MVGIEGAPKGSEKLRIMCLMCSLWAPNGSLLETMRNKKEKIIVYRDLKQTGKYYHQFLFKKKPPVTSIQLLIRGKFFNEHTRLK